MHENDNAPHSDAGQTAPLPNQTKYPDTSPSDPHDTPQSHQHKESTLDKIKEALHIK
jgi:hypothetical protein